LQHLAKPCLAQAMEVEAPAFPLARRLRIGRVPAAVKPCVKPGERRFKRKN
jgi:hypothetical protein